MKLTVSNSNITNNLSTAKLTLANGTISDNLTIGNVSITPSQISVGSATITPTAVSVPSLILGGAQFGGSLQGGIINYQEFTANGTWSNPYANASVNASLTGYEQVLVMAWGGGGGGHSNGTSGSQIAGGGGACVISTAPLLYFSNTCSVVVGNGGAVNRTSSGVAAFGGNTTFTINATANIVAYGGGPADGSSISSGGGGGTLGPATNFGTGGGPLGGSKGSVSTFGGGGGLGNNSGSFTGGTSIFGGGAGSGASFAGANSIYGGGGGGAGGSVGGTSIFGGNGGSRGLPAGIPGGGGGSNSTSANSGARGEVRVWVFGPAGTTAGAPTYTLTANTTTLYEGSSVLYTVSTTNVANSTTFYYTLNNSSTAVATDFTTAVNGSVVINGGTGTFTLTANNDADATNEAFTMDIRTGSTTGSIVASNGSVSIVPAPSEVVSYTTYTTDVDVTSVVVDKPVGVQQGDILLFVGCNGSTSSDPATPPSGWTELYDFQPTGHVYAAYKIADASEPSTYTFTLAASRGFAGFMIVIRNVNYSRHNTSTTATPSLSNSPANSIIVAVVCSDSSSANYTPPTNFTSLGSMTSGGGSDGTIGVAHRKITTTTSFTDAGSMSVSQSLEALFEFTQN